MLLAQKLYAFCNVAIKCTVYPVFFKFTMLLQCLKPCVFCRTEFYLSRYSISYQFSNDVESKLAKFLQLIGTVKRTILKKMRTETILKLYNTLVLRTFLYGSENWTLTALQRLRIEAAEMKLWKPLAGYTHSDHKTGNYISRKVQITGILDKIDEYRWN